MNKLTLLATAICFTVCALAAWAVVFQVIFNVALSSLTNIHLTYTNAFGILLLTRIIK